MSGQITLKVKYGADIRKAVLPSAEINSFGAITNWIAETYNLNDSNNLLLKYMDGEGDLVTFTNDEDLHLALSTESLFYVHVFSNSEDTNAIVSQLLKEIDHLKHTMDNLKIMIEDNASYLSQGRYSRPSTPPNHKSESIATIQPSVHEEIDHNGVARIVSSEIKEQPRDDMSSSHHDENQHMENIPIDQHSSHSPHPNHEHQHQQQQHPPQFPPPQGGNNNNMQQQQLGGGPPPQQQNSGFAPPPPHGFPPFPTQNQQQPPPPQQQQQFLCHHQ
uniref:PB1 domain-containing protein n=1 Tax=Panagrolaimus superbus TaxID=310955 RepID=A0A914ZCQ8_9BILA